MADARRPGDDRRLVEGPWVTSRARRGERGDRYPLHRTAGDLLDALDADAVVDDAVVDDRVVGDVGGVVDDDHVAGRRYDDRRDARGQDVPLADEGEEAGGDHDAAEAQTDPGAESHGRTQRRPAEVASAVPPGHPGGCPDGARDPGP